MAKLSHDDIATLWVQMGGAPSKADVAAAHALAESSGDTLAQNVNNDQWHSEDIGLFQINNHYHPDLADYTISKNIKGAILLSGDGVNWRAWCTSWSDNACGSKGGTYLGSGAAFHQYVTGGYTDTGIHLVTSQGTEVLVDKNGKNIENQQIETGGDPSAGTGVDTGAGGNAQPGIGPVDFLSWTKALGKILSYLLSGKFWLRIGQGLASAVLLLIGLGLVFRRDAMAAAKIGALA